MALAAIVMVVGCGGSGSKATAVPTKAAAAVAEGVPKVGVDAATVSIQSGTLDPSLIHGQAGDAFALTLHGNGHTHTLKIPGLVDTTEQIKATGDTTVRFTVPKKDIGRMTILLDGKNAGTFESEAPSGVYTK